MENQIDWTVVARLRRQLKAWSQADLARAAGLSRAGVCVIEQAQRADPYASTVYKLASALGLTTDELYTAVGFSPTDNWPVEFNSQELYLVRLYRAMDARGQEMLLELAGSLTRIRAHDQM